MCNVGVEKLPVLKNSCTPSNKNSLTLVRKQWVNIDKFSVILTLEYFRGIWSVQSLDYYPLNALRVSPKTHIIMAIAKCIFFRIHKSQSFSIQRWVPHPILPYYHGVQKQNERRNSRTRSMLDFESGIPVQASTRFLAFETPLIRGSTPSCPSKTISRSMPIRNTYANWCAN